MSRATRQQWIDAITSYPLKTYSRMVGALASIPVPKNLRQAVWTPLATNLGMDLTEAELALSEYGTFGDLFVRRLKPGRRPIDGTAASVVSPVDARVSAAGYATGRALIQAKGVDYSVAELLGNAELAQALNGGAYVTLYLRPKDYHRIHCPLDAEIVAARRIPGTLYPVQPWAVKYLPGLFVRNERLVVEMKSALGRFALICVGATGVGSIQSAFGEVEGEVCYQHPVRIGRGDELAAFKLGSTVIMVFEAGRVALGEVALEDEVRVGQILGRATPTDKSTAGSNEVPSMGQRND